MFKYIAFVIALGAVVGASYDNIGELEEGSKCNATDCSVKGTCERYCFCERTSTNPDIDDGTVVCVSCSDRDLFFDPVNSNEIGVCSSWGSLPKAVQDIYLQDKECTYCDIFGNPNDCSPDYIIRDNDGNTSNKSCPSPLLFKRAVRGCVEVCP